MRPKSTSDVRALLLCAGLGTRLEPFTRVLPKCLMPINGRPLLEYWLKLLVQGGITRILVNTHHHSDLIHRYVKSSEFSPFVTLTYEEELLGTAGTLLQNREFFGHADILLIHADNLSHFNLANFIAAHCSRPEKAVFTMMTFQTDNPSACGIIEKDADGLVVRFHEKVKHPPNTIANGAVYAITPQVIDEIKELNLRKVDWSTQVIPRYLGKISTFHNSIYHRDIGSPESYFRAQIEYPLAMGTLSKQDSWVSLLSANEFEIIRRAAACFKR